MTILVTGGTGFLGAHVVAQLASADRAVRALVRPGRPRGQLDTLGVECVEGDMLDEKSLRQACRGAEAIIHCAARTGYWSKQDHEQRHVNVEGTARLYRAAQDHAIERIVHVSSVAAIGATRDGSVLDETAQWNLGGIGVNYIATKREAEERALAAAWGGMPIVIVNPSMVLGLRPDGRARTLVTRVASGRARWAPPGGTSVCDVEDVARATIAALDRGRVGERYALGGHNLSWRELYGAIAELAGTRARLRSIPPAVVRALALGAGACDVFGLARPPWTPELFRSWGWYTFVDSRKAQAELGYSIRPLGEMLERAGARAQR